MRRTKRFSGIERGDELSELDEQKCTQKIGILPGTTKKWRIKRIKRWRIKQILLYNWLSCNV